MKKLLLFFILSTAFSAVGTAQMDKVIWITEADKINSNLYQVTLTADVVDGWYIYSQFMEDGGPIPTAINFTGNGIQVEGETNETGENMKELFDPVFEIDIKKFGGKVQFSQLVKTTSASPKLTANVTFMTCNDEMCLPPKQVELPISLN